MEDYLIGQTRTCESKGSQQEYEKTHPPPMSEVMTSVKCPRKKALVDCQLMKMRANVQMGVQRGLEMWEEEETNNC